MFNDSVIKQETEGEETRYEYDSAGRCMEERTKRGVKYFSYNRTDCLTQVKDEEEQIVRFSYDMAGKKTGIVKSYSGSSSDEELKIQYDLLDNITGIITPEGNVYSYKIRPDGNVVKAIHPNTYDMQTGDGEGMTFDRGKYQ